ncbi:acyl-CoA dehydrogenase [Moorella sulfitireducens (nom. illeg.)]|uniref:acyl-CoA dehydrogenase n=1 Tax=Neomoorella sulfitireducens TaxID=2972948 RepID=UPI0021AC7A26|nr:acyl-CoA dehydrogenase [Moorella sulfitireducens]
MDFRKTEEQELLLESLRELITREFSEEYFKECDEKHQYPEKFMKALVDNGFGLLGIPEEYGGTPVDTLTLILVSEEIARLGAPGYLFGSVLQIDDMLTFGSEEQKKITMELTKQGKIAFCLGITEPQAGSDTNAISTTFTRKNGKVYINGHKTFITGAMSAPYMLCMTRDFSVSDLSRAFTMWWVPMDAPGVRIEPLHKIGWFMQNTCEVYLDNVEIEEKDIVGREGYGFIQLMKNFEVERLLMAAIALGQAECAFEDAARYANQRVQFGKPIGTFQLIQEKLTYMAIKIENMRNMVYKCAWEKDNGISLQVSSALAKLYCAQASFEVIDDAMQIMGGIGYTTDHRISRLWRDNRINRIGGGTDQIMIHIAGRGILKQYR